MPLRGCLLTIKELGDAIINAETSLLEYADDVIVTDTEMETQTSINAIMTSFGDYFSAAVLSLNQGKAKIVLFHRHVQPQKMEIIVGDIKEADSTESEPRESLRS